MRPPSTRFAATAVGLPNRPRSLESVQAVQICAQVCLAMIELHNAGLVHGGPVPQWRSQWTACAVKVVDFAFAAPMDEPERDPGGLTGYHCQPGYRIAAFVRSTTTC